MFSFQFERRKVYARGGLTSLTWRNSGPLLPWMTTPFSFMYRIYTKYYARGFCLVVFCSGELSTDFTNILHGTSLPLGQWYYDDILAHASVKKLYWSWKQPFVRLLFSLTHHWYYTQIARHTATIGSTAPYGSMIHGSDEELVLQTGTRVVHRSYDLIVRRFVGPAPSFNLSTILKRTHRDHKIWISGI